MKLDLDQFDIYSKKEGDSGDEEDPWINLIIYNKYEKYKIQYIKSCLIALFCII